MSSDIEKFENELRANKIEQIKLLSEQLVGLNQEAYKDYKIAPDKPIPYYEATIDILKKQKINHRFLIYKCMHKNYTCTFFIYSKQQKV